MKLSLTTDQGEVFQLEVDRDCELQNLRAAIEAETQVPAAQQVLLFNGQPLTGEQTTLRQAGVAEFDVILVRRRPANPAARQAARQQPQQQQQQQQQQLDPATLERIVRDPQLFQQLQERNPALAQAILAALPRGMTLLPQAPMQEFDEFDPENQRRLEEEIRQQNVNQQLEHAMEYAPETFGRVFMLYIACEVNGQKVKAFVDSGAQMTIMSLEFAQRCGLSNFMDTRFTGVAKGVGSAKIVGRVHMAQLKIESLFLPVSFTILENQSIELLLGLDMLKRHQCILDLRANVLRIGSVATPFLAEADLPASARHDSSEGAAESDQPASSSSSARPAQPPVIVQPPVAAANPPFATANAPIAATQSSTQPGPQPSTQPQPAQPTSGFPEATIAALMEFGASRAQAIAALKAAGGNPDLAASFLFQ